MLECFCYTRYASPRGRTRDCRPLVHERSTITQMEYRFQHEHSGKLSRHDAALQATETADGNSQGFQSQVLSREGTRAQREFAKNNKSVHSSNIPENLKYMKIGFRIQIDELLQYAATQTTQSQKMDSVQYQR